MFTLSKIKRFANVVGFDVICDKGNRRAGRVNFVERGRERPPKVSREKKVVNKNDLKK